MKNWILSIGLAKFQIGHALLWAAAIVLIDWIADRSGGASITLWLAVAYVLVNGAIIALVFGNSTKSE